MSERRPLVLKDGQVSEIPVGDTLPPELVLGAGTSASPFTELNVKRVPISIYHKIKENYENVVSNQQFVDGVLIIDGVNTIL